MSPVVSVAAEAPPPLYTASLSFVYFFAAWGDRMWEFAVIVFLLEVFPGTLLPPSLFGLFENVAGIALGTSVGGFIDRTERLKSMRISIVGQNTVIWIVSAMFAMVLWNPSRWSMEIKYGLLACILVAGMVAKVSASMNKICVHKIWAVALGNGHKGHQSRINSQLRRVDLTCSILAPLAVGVLSSTIGSAITCMIIAGWSLVSTGIEWYLSNWFYHRVASLQGANRILVSKKPAFPASKETETNCLTKQLGNFRVFMKHRCFWASVPYCMLYISVLSFGGIMVSYLRTLGVDNMYLAIGRACAAFVAIGSTFAIPYMVEFFGLVETGVRAVWAQVLCLTPLAVMFVAYPDHESQKQSWFILVVFVCVCLSRFGLWGFDLAQTHIMQELVEIERAGAINGAQETLMNTCWLGSFVLTAVFHDPSQFKMPALISYFSIFSAAVIFAGSSVSIATTLKSLAAPAKMHDEDTRKVECEDDLSKTVVVQKVAA